MIGIWGKNVALLDTVYMRELTTNPTYSSKAHDDASERNQTNRKGPKAREVETGDASSRGLDTG